MPTCRKSSVNPYKGLILTALLLLFYSAYCMAQKPAGTYRLTLVFLKDSSQLFARPSDKLYLYKANWNSLFGTLIDSTVIDRKNRARFSGKVFALDTRINQDSVFTAGEFYVKNQRSVLFSFLYSPMDGGYLKETFLESSDGNLRWHRKGFKPHKATDQDMYQSYSPEIRDRIWNPSLSDLIQAEKKFPNSLVTKFLKFYSKQLSASDPIQLPEIADERLYYTSFGKQYIDIFLDKFKLSNEKVRNMAIDYLMENRYLTDPRMKAAVAMECFRRYSSSIVMGAESGAVYAAEKYILGNEAVAEKDRAEAAYYVTLNKGTLFGSKAPELSLKDTAGTLRSTKDLMGAYSIIYFYSDDCNYCKVETPRFMEFIDSYDQAPLNIMTVYTGTDSKAWKEYVKENFRTINPLVNWIHVADIERESRFPVDYGVASTPKMFLLDESLRIRGRGILTPTLSKILEDEGENSKKAYEYLSTIFSPSGDIPEDELTKTWKSLADRIYQGSNSSDDNYRRLMRQTFMYLYFNEKQTAPLRETAAYLGQRYILDMADRWEDTVFVESVRSAVNSINMNRVGSKAENLHLYDVAGNPSDLLPLDKKYKLLFFYRSNCGVCSQTVGEIMSAFRKYSRKVTFIGIHAGANVAGWKKFIISNNLEFIQLYDKDNLAGLEKYYYVESVPQILLVGPDDIIVARLEGSQVDSALDAIVSEKSKLK